MKIPQKNNYSSVSANYAGRGNETRPELKKAKVEGRLPFITFNDGICNLEIDPNQCVPSCKEDSEGNKVWRINYKPTGFYIMWTFITDRNGDIIKETLKENREVPKYLGLQEGQGGLCLAMFTAEIPEHIAQHLCNVNGVDPETVTHRVKSIIKNKKFGE